MADLVLILAGPAVGLALVAGYLLGRRSNVQRKVDAVLARETVLPAPIWSPPAGTRFETDLAAFKTIERFRMEARGPVVGAIVPFVEPVQRQQLLGHLCPDGRCGQPVWECRLIFRGRARPR